MLLVHLIGKEEKKVIDWWKFGVLYTLCLPV
jgi:hypothetical protein